MGNRKKPPATPPRLNKVIRRIAMLGGFLDRKGDEQPGAKTLWSGIQRITEFIIARQLDKLFG